MRSSAIPETTTLPSALAPEDLLPAGRLRGELADDLLDDVLDGDEPEQLAVLVDDEAQPLRGRSGTACSCVSSGVPAGMK